MRNAILLVDRGKGLEPDTGVISPQEARNKLKSLKDPKAIYAEVWTSSNGRTKRRKIGKTSNVDLTGGKSYLEGIPGTKKVKEAPSKEKPGNDSTAKPSTTSSTTSKNGQGKSKSAK